MEISVNGKSVLELNQPQPFHREDFVCIKVDETVEHIYIYKENKSEKFVAFGLTYPNIKGVPLRTIDSIANKLRLLKRDVYAETGYISYRMEIANEMTTPFVVIMCKYVFYFGFLLGDNSRGPETMIVLLGVRKFRTSGFKPDY
ncbi:hypothetical protein [Porphyromonas sp.]